MRWFMTLLWLSVIIGPFAADFNATHLFNPDWPPHARLHMMTVFTSAAAVGVFGCYLCWGPAGSRQENLKLGAILGFLYSLGLVVACLTMPFYGGSLYLTDIEPRPPSLNDQNLVVFIWVTLIFGATLIFLHWQSRKVLA